jgi:hypothetical protein
VTTEIGDAQITPDKLSFTPVARPLTPPIATGEIGDAQVTGSKMQEASITPTKLSAINTPTDGQVPAKDDASGKFKWITPAGGAPAGLFQSRRNTADDFRETAFIRDNTWKINGLDLSGIVPAGATEVLLNIWAISGTPTDMLWIRTNDTDASNNIAMLMAKAEYIYETGQFVLPIDADRKLDYKIAASYSTLHLNVVGWYV